MTISFKPLPVLALLPFVAACADIEAGLDPATGEATATPVVAVVTPEARPQVAAPVATAPAPTPAVVVTPARGAPCGIETVPAFVAHPRNVSPWEKRPDHLAPPTSRGDPHLSDVGRALGSSP